MVPCEKLNASLHNVFYRFQLGLTQREIFYNHPDLKNINHILHLEIVGGLDSWEGMRGHFVSQRALMKGIAGIEQSKEIFEESHLALIDGTC